MLSNLSKPKEYAIHILFWLFYYILFSFIWVRNGDYVSSFYLEFIYMPIRLVISYGLILYLVPQILVEKKFVKFFSLYALILTVGSIIQSLFFYFFFEGNTEFLMDRIFDARGLIRAAILLNTTSILVASIKILSLYFEEKQRHSYTNDNPIDLKSNRRTFRVFPHEINYIEGMGNYVIYHLEEEKKIIVYQSLKKALASLFDNFERVHKSYIVNKNKVVSYDNETLELSSGDMIPLGKNSSMENLFKV